MPIRPELKPLYPGGGIRSAEWLALREHALDQANHCCEFCGAQHEHQIWRLADGEFITAAGGVYCDRTGRLIRLSDPAMEGGTPIVIVLSLCHKDHDPAHNQPENHMVLCQRCHLRHDADHHRQTRRRRNAIGDLFDRKIA
ncbi:MAG: hypothetical protein ACR2P3_09190 [Geminicoccaceae bacterium]